MVHIALDHASNSDLYFDRNRVPPHSGAVTLQVMSMALNHPLLQSSILQGERKVITSNPPLDGGVV